jgi:putative peptidoglycan lipid II flippase
MDEAITFALALTLPAAAALTAMPFFLIDGLFTRGQFTTIDAHATSAALFHYGWGVPAFVLARVCAPAFFARQDTKTPMRFALISVGVNIVAGLVLFYLVGFQGIAAATSIAAWLNVGQMAWKLHRLDEYRPSAQAWSRVARILAASLVLAAEMAAASHFREIIEGPLRIVRIGHVFGAKEIAVILIVMVGGLSYVPLLFAFGGLKLSEIKAALRRKPDTIEEDLGKTPAGPGLL